MLAAVGRMESMRSQDSSSGAMDASSTSAAPAGGAKTIAKLGSFVSCE